MHVRWPHRATPSPPCCRSRARRITGDAREHGHMRRQPVTAGRALARAGPAGRRQRGVPRRDVRGSEVAQHRTGPRRPLDRRGGQRAAPARVLLRRDRRRPVEDDRRRHDVEARRRQVPEDVVGRRRGGGRVEPRRRVRRDGRERSCAATSSRATASTSRPTAGKTWTHVGLADSQAIARIRVHPKNPDLVYVAALGNPYAASAAARRLPLEGRRQDVGAGAVPRRQDRRRRPVDGSEQPGRAVRRRCGRSFRTPHSLSSGGPGSGLFKSTDGGDDVDGADEEPRAAGRAAGARSACRCRPPTASASTPSSRTRTAACSCPTMRGATWKQVNDERRLRQRAFYYTRIYADPKDRDTVYVLNTGFYRSTDAGKTYKRVPRAARRQPRPVDRAERPEADDQRQRRRRQRVGERRRDAGPTRTFPTAQFYNVFVTAHVPYHVCGAQQDNSTACVSSAGRRARALRRRRRRERLHRAGPAQSRRVLRRAATAGISRATTGKTGRDARDQRVARQPDGLLGEGHHRALPVDVPDRLLAGRPAGALRRLAARLEDDQRGAELGADQPGPDAARSDDDGAVGRADHARPDRRRDVRDGVHDRAVAARRPDASGPAPTTGCVHVTRDGGKTWDNVTPKDLPDFARISLVEASPHKPGTAFVAANRYQRDDRAPYVYRTDDYGKTWTKIVSGAPGAPTSRAPSARTGRRPGLLYLGTEHGIYVSFDDGGDLAVAAPRPAGHAGARHRVDRERTW